MPNTLASIVLFGWPVVVFFLFKRLSVPAALSWSIIGGYLLIPTRVGIDLPLLPVLNKETMPSLAAAVMCLMIKDPKTKGRGRVAASGLAQRQSRGGKIFTVVTILLVIAPFFTASTNAEILIYGPKRLSSLRNYDAFSMILSAIVMILPFVLARKHLATPEAHATLLKAVCLAGVAYAFLALFEIRMSPQLNRWIYGFFPHSFAQHIRGGGFRPLVFLPHGLWLGVYLAMSVLSAAVLYRAKKSETGHGKWVMALLWLFVTLFLSKNLGALLTVFMLLPVALMFGVRMQMFAAAFIAVSVLFYPILRGNGLVPVDSIHAAAHSIDPARAGSLKYRLDNEDMLLAHAQKKPLFGWGGWGRNRVYDAETGRDLSTTDGLWVIVIGLSGWFGYIGQFGLLTLPVILVAYRSKKLGLTLASSGLAVVLSANLIDLLPNAGLVPLTWLMAGALAGRYTLQGVSTAPGAETATETAPVGRRRARVGHTRAAVP